LLKIGARLDPNVYEKGQKVSDEVMAEIPIKRHQINPQWNYTIQPK